MAKCPNCGQETYGDSCPWCNYPLIKRRFPWQVSREARSKKRAEQEKFKAEQAVKDVAEDLNSKVEEDTVMIVAKSRRKFEQLAEEIKDAVAARREAERIIEEWTRKVREENGEEPHMAMGGEEKATVQVAEQTPPSQVGSPGLQRHPSEVTREVQVTDKIKVFVIDDQSLFRQGLRQFLSRTDDIELIAESDFLENSAAIVATLQPSLVLIDINLPWLSGLGLAQRLSQRSPDMSVIVLTPYEDDNQIFEALKAGVAGCLSKDIAPEVLASAIRRVFEGERIIDELLVRPGVARRVLKQFQGMEKEGLIKPLQPQEMEILGYFADGYSPEKVAHALGVSELQITSRITSIILKILLAAGLPDSTS